MRALALSFAALFFLSACKIEVKPPQVTVNSTVDVKDVLTCSAAVSHSAESGVAIPITVKAAGGAAPYQVVNTAIAFTAQTVLSRTYTNSGNSNIDVVDTIVVKDNLGHVTQCNFLVTVTPVGIPSDLACTLVATPSSPAINANVTFVASATGGDAPYTFNSFAPGTNGTIQSALTPISLVSSQAIAKYSTSGLRTASVQLTDDQGDIVTCSTSVNVAPAPSVSLVASPATSVVFGNNITLTATPAAFSGTPTYTFTTTRSGVTITKVGAVATVSATSAQSAFNVVVTATYGSQTATSTISLSFLNPTSLACTLSHVAGTYYTNDTVKFDVTATNGDALEITYAATNGDYTLQAWTDSSRSFSYSIAGTKTVQVKARSKVTGALCQNGALMSDTVVINAPVTPALTCTGQTFYNPSYTYEWFRAWATISGGSGLNWVDTITITKNGNNYIGWDGDWIDATSAWLRIFNAGTYVVKFNLRDASGNVGSCTTTQVVTSY